MPLRCVRERGRGAGARRRARRARRRHRGSGGGVVAIRPRALSALEAVLGDLGRARKAPWRLAKIFGLGTLVGYATRTLDVAACERRASAILRTPVAAAICTHPEIAVNVDRVSDVALAEALVR